MEFRANNCSRAIANRSRANNRTAARNCYWLYVVTNCLPAATGAAQAGTTSPQLQEPIKHPARLDWHEATKVAHYYLSLDALTKPMQVREESPGYGGHR
ncbi:MAG: hypothetical protein RB146_04445 [Armatimonadota bacterium]|nr:hypothetical protein [Armatimonadota bacterium]